MTTVAYRDGIIAADRQVTGGSRVVGSVTKIRVVGAEAFGATGNLAYAQSFLSWIEGGRVGDCPVMGTSDEDDASGFVLCGRKVVEYHYQKMDRFELDQPYFASGSGSAYALGAMAMGATAEEAVRVAARFDLHTGAVVDVLRTELAV